MSRPLNSVGQQITLPAPPPTLPAWAKVAWYLAEGVAVGISWKLYDYGESIFGAGGADEPQEWRKFVLHFADTISNSPADDQITTFHVVNFTNGHIDSSWTQGDYDQVYAALDVLGPSFMPHVCNRLVWDRTDAYRMAYNDYGVSLPFADSGPPEYSRAFAVTGGDPTNIPPQICTTVTKRTLTRKNWGRMYLPTFGGNAWGSNGRYSGHLSLATGFAAFVSSLAQNQLFVVVPATSTSVPGGGSTPLRVLQGVQEISVDDVPDVQRRRRFRESLTKTVLPVSAMTQPADELVE